MGVYEIALCGDCDLRPIDQVTGLPVEGGICAVERTGEFGKAAVLFSEDDPRIHLQVRVADGTDINTAVRKANDCTGMAEGLVAGLGDIQARVKAAEKHRNKNPKQCRIGNTLQRDQGLPSGLLFQTSEQ